MVVGGYRVGPLLKQTGKEILADDLPSLAAATAYNFFFSLFPLFLFAAPLIGLIGDERRIVNWAMTQLATVVPEDALALVQGVVQDVVFTRGAPGLISVGALLAAWSGSNIFRSLMDALNRAYGVQETRPWWKRTLISLVALLVTGALLFIASTIMLAGPEIVGWIGRRLHLESASVIAWTALQYPIALVFLIGAFFMIYRFLPNLRQGTRQVLVGATVAGILWVVVTLGFRLYVTNFGSYNTTYGTVGAVIVVLTWMYLTMLVILAGGELNAELHHGTGAVEPRKGAVYAGRVVTETQPSRPSTERVVPMSARESEHHGDPTRG